MILVTGGAGYIGSQCVKILAERGFRTVVVDNLSRGHREMVLAGEWVQGDLGDGDMLSGVMRHYGVRTVIHFAALSLVGESEEKPHQYYMNNVGGGLRLLDAMLKTGVDRIVFSSSAAVYGEPAALPIEEDHPTRPTNVYGGTKLIFENILRQYARTYGIRFLSLRYFNAAGADPDNVVGEDHTPETHLVPLVLDAAMGRRPEIAIYGTDYDTPDGTCIRDYVHVRDLAEAHVLALDRLEEGPCAAFYNIGSGSGFSVREVIRSAEKTTGVKIRVSEGRRRPGDPARLVASSRRIEAELGWKPAFSDLDTIIGTAWNWHRRRFGGK